MSGHRLSIERVREKVVSFLGRKQVGRKSDTNGRQQTNGGPDGAEVKGGIQMPTWDSKLVVMVIQICLMLISC